MPVSPTKNERRTQMQDIKLNDDHCYLDKVRLSRGPDECKARLMAVCSADKARAACLLNDRRLTFPCLYLLSPLIKRLNLSARLTPKNRYALEFITNVSKRKRKRTSFPKQTEHAVLSWILTTGSREDGISEEFEELLEIAASMLANNYKDRAALPMIVDMMFERNRKGRNIHDLVWALFRARDINVLKLIAERLKSGSKADAELARSLLNIDATKGDLMADNTKLYRDYMDKLTENKPFLYFTDEGYNFSSEPRFTDIDLERKYLNKQVKAYEHALASHKDKTQIDAAKAFNELSLAEQRLLSEYSYKKCKADPIAWSNWLKRPLAEQLKEAAKKEVPL